MDSGADRRPHPAQGDDARPRGQRRAHGCRPVLRRTDQHGRGESGRHAREQAGKAAADGRDHRRQLHAHGTRREAPEGTRSLRRHPGAGHQGYLPARPAGHLLHTVSTAVGRLIGSENNRPLGQNTSRRPYFIPWQERCQMAQ